MESVVVPKYTIGSPIIHLDITKAAAVLPHTA